MRKFMIKLSMGAMDQVCQAATVYLEPLHGAVVGLPVLRRLGDQLQVLVAEWLLWRPGEATRPPASSEMSRLKAS